LRRAHWHRRCSWGGRESGRWLRLLGRGGQSWLGGARPRILDWARGLGVRLGWLSERRRELGFERL
jgi:hypothetical protein